MYSKNTIKFVFTFTIFLLSISFSKQSAHCNELAENDNCEFYEKCVESNSFCGSTGYAMGFATPNCLKYITNIEKFSAANGQKFIKDSMKCLKKVLLPFREEKNCGEIMSVGLKNESQCYFESGLCNIIKDTANNNLNDFVKGLLAVDKIVNFRDTNRIQAFIEASDNCDREDFNRFIDMLQMYTD
jgi:hypothetical protein